MDEGDIDFFFIILKTKIFLFKVLEITERRLNMPHKIKTLYLGMQNVG